MDIYAKGCLCVCVMCLCITNPITKYLGGSQKRWKVELTPKSVKIENTPLQFYRKKLEIMHLLKTYYLLICKLPDMLLLKQLYFISYGWIILKVILNFHYNLYYTNKCNYDHGHSYTRT